MFPSNPIHYCFYHKNPDILQLYTDSRYNKKKSTNKNINKTFEKILLKFEKDICLTHKDKDTFNFIFQTIGTQAETKENTDNTLKDSPQQIKCLSNDIISNKAITEESEKPKTKTIYERRRIKPMNSVNTNKTCIIYSKKISNSKRNSEHQKNINNINNITINLNDKSKGSPVGLTDSK